MISLNRNITQTELLAGYGEAVGNVTAIHYCHPAGGISAFFAESAGTLKEKVEKIRGKIRASGGVLIPGARADQELNSRFAIPEDFRVCGLELRTSRAEMVALRERQKDGIRVVEVTNTAMRMLPIHTTK